MQDEKSTKLDFSGRTDALAAKLGVDVGELPDTLGFSRASLFAYRSGKANISNKAWRKLEQAERAAGLAPPIMEQFQSAKTNAQAQRVLESASYEEIFRSLPPEAQALLAKGRLDAIHFRMIEFLLNAEGLACQVEEYLKNPTDKEMKRDLLSFVKTIKQDYQPARELWDAVHKSLRSRWETAEEKA